MTKRANQIALLKRLDAVSPDYTYNDLVNIVYDGIVEKHGKTPSELLTAIYNTATANVNGTTDTSTEETKDTSFWESLANGLNSLQQVISSINFGNTNNIQPSSSDWNNPHQSASMFSMDSLMSFAPYLVAGGILLFVMNNRK